jgi:hypothetical protein
MPTERDIPTLYQEIGEFMYVFSQLEFALRAPLGAALKLDIDVFDAVTGNYDFSRLCDVTQHVLLKASAGKYRLPDSEIERIIKACRNVNDHRNRVAHGVWSHPGGVSKLKLGKRRTLEEVFYYTAPEDLTQGGI